MPKYHVTDGGRIMVCKAWTQDKCWYRGNPHVEAADRKEAQKKMDEVLPEWIEKKEAKNRQILEQKEKLEKEIASYDIAKIPKLKLYQSSEKFEKISSYKELNEHLQKKYPDKKVVGHENHRKIELSGASYLISRAVFEDKTVSSCHWIKIGDEKIREFNGSKFLLHYSGSGRFRAWATCSVVENSTNKTDENVAFEYLLEETGHIWELKFESQEEGTSFCLSGYKD